MKRPGRACAKVPSHVVSEEVGGEAVLLNLQTGNYFALNRTATRMWQLIRSGLDADEVCESVSTEFGVDKGRVEGDYKGLLADLTRRGLLEDASDCA